jgi:heparanase
MKKSNILTLILLCFSLLSNAQKASTNFKNRLNLKSLKYLGSVDERFQSYNIEMCEVIGGDFWVPYELIDSVQKHSGKTGFAALK